MLNTHMIGNCAMMVNVWRRSSGTFLVGHLSPNYSGGWGCRPLPFCESIRLSLKGQPGSKDVRLFGEAKVEGAG